MFTWQRVEHATAPITVPEVHISGCDIQPWLLRTEFHPACMWHLVWGLGWMRLAIRKNRSSQGCNWSTGSLSTETLWIGFVKKTETYFIGSLLFFLFIIIICFLFPSSSCFSSWHLVIFDLTPFVLKLIDLFIQFFHVLPEEPSEYGWVNSRNFLLDKVMENI